MNYVMFPIKPMKNETEGRQEGERERATGFKTMMIVHEDLAQEFKPLMKLFAGVSLRVLLWHNLNINGA